jgi:casein kinase 1
MIFASRNAFSFVSQSRRDDIESLAYLLVYFLKGKASWIEQNDLKVNKLQRLGQIKQYMTPGKLCAIGAEKLVPFVKLAFSYSFTDEPHYGKLRFSLLSAILDEG